jgi:hypothetical protein
MSSSQQRASLFPTEPERELGIPSKKSKALAISEEFTKFWDLYPHKIGKLAALKAYLKARQTASVDEIRAGVTAYMDSKPAWQAYANPATWLNQGRWQDVPFEERRRLPRYDWRCPHDPPCCGRHACHIKDVLEKGRL